MNFVDIFIFEDLQMGLASQKPNLTFFRVNFPPGLLSPPHIFQRECKQALDNTPLNSKTPLCQQTNKPGSQKKGISTRHTFTILFDNSQIKSGKQLQKCWYCIVVRADGGARADARYRVQGPIPGTPGWLLQLDNKSRHWVDGTNLQHDFVREGCYNRWSIIAPNEMY